MKTRNLVALVILVAMILTLTNSAMAVTATVTADALNLHVEPQGEVLGVVRCGEAVEVLDGPDRNGYYQISYKGQTYYVYGTYLNFGEDMPEMPRIGDASRHRPSRTSAAEADSSRGKFIETTMYYLGDDGYLPMVFVNAKVEISLREYPYGESLRLGWCIRGLPLVVTDTRIRNGFVKVKTLDGRIEGYTYVKYLSLNPIEDALYEFELCEILDSDIISENEGKELVCWTNVTMPNR